MTTNVISTIGNNLSKSYRAKLWIYYTSYYPAMHYLFRGHISRSIIIRRYCKNTPNPSLHVGCGKNYLTGWLNADLFTGNIYLDARKPFPFKDNALKYIFCEHLLEHLSLQQGTIFLKESYRTLKQGGVLRLTMPVLEKIIDLYFGTTKNTGVTRQQFLDTIGKPELMPCELFNSYFYSHGHRFIYDKSFIVLTLKRIGFKDIAFYENKKSTHKQLIDIEKHGDLQNLAEALTIEAIK